MQTWFVKPGTADTSIRQEKRLPGGLPEVYMRFNFDQPLRRPSELGLAIWAWPNPVLNTSSIVFSLTLRTIITPLHAITALLMISLE